MSFIFFYSKSLILLFSFFKHSFEHASHSSSSSSLFAAFLFNFCLFTRYFKTVRLFFELFAEFTRNDNRMSSRPCPVCQKIISNKSNLVKHMRIKHGGSYLQEASCHICGKVFKHKYSLSAHMYSLHRSANADTELMTDHDLS